MLLWNWVRLNQFFISVFSRRWRGTFFIRRVAVRASAVADIRCMPLRRHPEMTAAFSRSCSIRINSTSNTLSQSPSLTHYISRYSSSSSSSSSSPRQVTRLTTAGSKTVWNVGEMTTRWSNGHSGRAWVPQIGHGSLYSCAKIAKSATTFCSWDGAIGFRLQLIIFVVIGSWISANSPRQIKNLIGRLRDLFIILFTYLFKKEQMAKVANG